MIRAIAQSQFDRLFPKPPVLPGSFAEALRLQTIETQWYEDRQNHRIGVLVYDRYDQDWHAIILKKGKGGYQSFQMQTSLPSEKTALDALFQLFGLTHEDFRRFMVEQNSLTIERTGRSLEEIFLEPHS
jgi:hypothetical protein